MRPTNSPFSISRSTSFNATTWNSSRTNSFVSRRAVITGSLIFLLFDRDLVALGEIRRRIDDEVFAADQSVLDARALADLRPCLHRAPHRSSIQRHKNSA